MDGGLLLARAKGYTTDFYSMLTGFVKPGGTLEEGVALEVQEEVGIRVKVIPSWWARCQQQDLTESWTSGGVVGACCMSLIAA